jgi:hypothetical protein
MSIRLHGLDWVDWVSFFGRAFNMFNTWGKRLYDLYGIHRYQLLGLCGDQNASPGRWRIHRWPYQHCCPAHPTTFASSLVGTILARCAKRCASPSRLQSMTVGLFTVFFCGVTLLRIVNPGLGICQTTKKTLKVWSNAKWIKWPHWAVPHLFSPSPVDVKWAPMSGTWLGWNMMEPEMNRRSASLGTRFGYARMSLSHKPFLWLFYYFDFCSTQEHDH